MFRIYIYFMFIFFIRKVLCVMMFQIYVFCMVQFVVVVVLNMFNMYRYCNIYCFKYFFFMYMINKLVVNNYK